MGTKKRAKARRPHRGMTPPRFAEGRADSAVDWVGGIGWQDPDTGRLTMEMILALHHDQGCALHRTHEIAQRLSRVRTIGLPNEIELISMPVRTEVGDAVHRQLAGWLQHKDATKRLVGRMGLGIERPGRIPAQFRIQSKTAPNGEMTKPLEAEAFAVLEDDVRLVGQLDAGKPQFTIGTLETEPEYVAGIGFRHNMRVHRMPEIMQVLGLGKTGVEAARNGETVFRARGLEEQPDVILKIARVTKLDGHMLRVGMETSMKKAEGSLRTILEMGLGLKDDVAQQGAEIVVPEEIRVGLGEEEPAQVTVNDDGIAELWEAGARTDPQWRGRVEGADAASSKQRAEDGAPGPKAT